MAADVCIKSISATAVPGHKHFGLAKAGTISRCAFDFHSARYSVASAYWGLFVLCRHKWWCCPKGRGKERG